MVGPSSVVALMIVAVTMAVQVPVGVTAGTTAAGTEEKDALLVVVLIEVGPGKFLAIVLTFLGVQRARSESEEADWHLMDLVSELETDNKPAVGTHSGEGPVKMAALIVVEPPGEAGPELTVALMYQMCCQSSWFQLQMLKLSRHQTGSCRKKTLSGQVEVWLVLSGHRQSLACL